MSATTILWLVLSLISFVSLVKVAVSLGGMVKSGTVESIQSHGRLFSAVILLLFALGVCSAILFAYSAHLGWMGRLYSVVTIILMLPFYLGATFVSSGDLKYKESQLVIAKGSLLNRVLFDWLGFSRSKEWNFCNISWLGALMIICIPIVSGVLSLLGLIIGLLRFLIGGESPHRALCRALGFRDSAGDVIFDDPKTIRVFGRRIFPIVWICFGWFVWDLFRANKVVGFIKTDYLLILITFGLIALCFGISLLLDRLENSAPSVPKKSVKEKIAPAQTSDQFGFRVQRFFGSVGSRVKQKAQYALEPLRPLQALWQAFKKKSCPRVVPES